MDDQKRIFASNLQAWLMIKGISQAELADKLQVSRGSISMWCNAITIPRMPKIQKIAEILNISVSDLVDLKSTEDRKRTKEGYELLSLDQVLGTDVGNSFSFQNVKACKIQEAPPKTKREKMQERLRQQQLNQIKQHIKRLNFEGLMKLEEILFDMIMNEEYTKPDTDDDDE